MKKHWPIITVLIVAAVLRVIHGVLPDIVSWDGSVYVGMGKYLFSGGAIGVWEVLRPIGWPIILGFLWSIGIDPYVAGVVIVAAASLWLVWLVYLIGERIRQHAGLIAAAILACTPLFFQYSTIPMTDITSTCLIVLALYVYIAKKGISRIFFAGLCIGLAAMFRFPQGLMLVAMGIIITIDAFPYQRNTIASRIGSVLQYGAMLALGFATVVVPFLIANYTSYGNAFLPFIEGNNIIKGYPELYHKGFWFYFTTLYKQHWLMVFALIPFLLFKRERFNKVLVYVLVILIVYLAYFLYQPHKEARYMLAFLPYIALCAGYGFVFLVEQLRVRPKVLFMPILAMGIIANINQLSSQTGDTPEVQAYAAYFNDKPNERILSTAPFPALSDVLIVQTLYNDWNDALQKYHTLRNDIDYISLDSCVLEAACKDDAMCYKNKDELLKTLEEKEKKVFSAMSNKCDMRIYNIQQ
jgi:hypothetical protein